MNWTKIIKKTIGVLIIIHIFVLFAVILSLIYGWDVWNSALSVYVSIAYIAIITVVLVGVITLIDVVSGLIEKLFD